MKLRSRDATALAAAWLAYRFVLDLEWVGWDSYPILAASHPADLSTTLFDRWMGGRYPRGDFYRPLSTLSFALDRALWDLVPRGFQRTNLLTLLFATGCSYRLASAAKETGVALLPAIVALHAGLAPQARRRLHFALTRSLPAITAVAGLLVLRTWVLGGLGGHPGSDPLSGLLTGPLAAAPHGISRHAPRDASSSCR